MKVDWLKLETDNNHHSEIRELIFSILEIYGFHYFKTEDSSKLEITLTYEGKELDISKVLENYKARVLNWNQLEKEED